MWPGETIGTSSHGFRQLCAYRYTLLDDGGSDGMIDGSDDRSNVSFASYKSWIMSIYPNIFIRDFIIIDRALIYLKIYFIYFLALLASRSDISARSA